MADPDVGRNAEAERPEAGVTPQWSEKDRRRIHAALERPYQPEDTAPHEVPNFKVLDAAVQAADRQEEKRPPIYRLTPAEQQARAVFLFLRGLGSQLRELQSRSDFMQGLARLANDFFQQDPVGRTLNKTTAAALLERCSYELDNLALVVHPDLAVTEENAQKFLDKVTRVILAAAPQRLEPSPPRSAPKRPAPSPRARKEPRKSGGWFRRFLRRR